MDDIRCLIADFPKRVLNDILHHVIGQSSGFSVVAKSVESAALCRQVQECAAEVVFIGMDSKVFPDICKEIFSSSKKTIMVGLVDDGRRAAIYIDDVGPSQLLELVRAAKSKSTLDVA
ncbi:MAG: hypothetical protein OEY78_13325 [Gammaproteobacteria bacterium]|nr:hypothetical protein [Gammaproteobacteria bacterium]